MKPLSKDDRRAVIVLIVLILACFLTFPYIDRCIAFFSGNEDKDSVALKDNRKRGLSSGYYAVDEKEAELFPFDPNTADSTQLLRLGLRPWQVRNIYKYRAAGGRYRKPTDFARLYGLTLEQYERLAPYINIKKEVMAADVCAKSTNDYVSHNQETPQRKATSDTVRRPSSGQSMEPRRVFSAYTKKIRPGEKIDISVADTSALKTIPGIGSYFSRQIVRHRERLGGFVDVSQLRDIEGFPESSLSYMVVGNSSSVKRMKVNALSAWQLSRHPYILYVQAKEIVEYRHNKGSISSPSQLESFKTITSTDLKRLLPYLDFSR
ncbi:MAG: helix-hairpin-helix domain-containing protein [Prevotella sp.]|nr:helix-hairpin-helix domain-containing protein [Prevotella sp.]